MVKLSQILPGGVEFFSHLLIKSNDPQSYSNGHKEVFLLQCTMKSQFLCSNNGSTALKLVANNF